MKLQNINVNCLDIALCIAIILLVFLVKSMFPLFSENFINSIKVWNISDTKVFQNNFNTLIQLIAVIVVVWTILGASEQIKILNKQTSYLSDQTQVLRNQFKISTFVNASVMAAQCLPDTMTGGDFAAYSMLLDLRKNLSGDDIVRIIDNRIIFVKNKHENLEDRVVSIPVYIKLTDGSLKSIEKDDLYNGSKYFQAAYDQFNHTGFWQTRAKVSYLMSFFNEEKIKERNLKITKYDILQSLIDKMKNDPSLFVRRIALQSYESLSNGNFKAIDVFDFDGAIRNWEH